MACVATISPLAPSIARSSTCFGAPTIGIPTAHPAFGPRGCPGSITVSPAGDAIVEVIPATAKMNINLATEEQLFPPPCFHRR